MGLAVGEDFQSIVVELPRQVILKRQARARDEY